MGKYKVILDKGACIGAGNCVETNDKNFKMTNDGKAIVITAEIDDKDLSINKLAAKGCPTGAIKIIDLTTNKEISL